MPCCMPRYAPVIVAGLDAGLGFAAVLLLYLFRDFVTSFTERATIVTPAGLAVFAGIISALAFVQKNRRLGSAAFGIHVLLVATCFANILFLAILSQASVFTPLLIAAQCYIIVIQLHFSWVMHDYCNHLRRMSEPLGSRKFSRYRKSLQEEMNLQSP